MSVPGSQVWTIPRRRDPDFVGRSAELAALEKALAATGRSALTQPASVHGLGGVGKSLLAVEFAYRHADDYDAVLWLAAENPTTLAAGFADLARELRLPEADEPDQGVRTAAVLRWLESHGRWLLIFDNAVRREDLDPYVPHRPAGHILITSRNPDWHPLARGIKVETLPRADSVALLRSGDEGGQEAEADRLASALGDLPLALAQAAAYVRQTGITFADYLGRFQARRAEIARPDLAEPGYGQTFSAMLSLALDALRGDRPEASPAERVLSRCAFWAPDRIPRELLAGEWTDATTLDDAIRTLRSFSLVETDAGTISVHRLVQWAVQGRMTPAEQAEFAEHAVDKVYERFPSRPQDARTWPECRRLLDHALHAAELAIQRDVAKTTVVGLLNLVGVHLSAAHDLLRAREQLQRALRIKESAYGPDHLLVAITLTNLGIVARQQGDLDEARRLLVRAMEIFKSAYGPDHPQVACTLNSLGLVAQEQGDPGEARRLHEQALGIFESAYGPDHPEVARALNNLGVVSQRLGDLARARRLLEQALGIKERAYGPDHPEVASTLINLAEVLGTSGETERAAALSERALAIFHESLGEEHPHTVRAREQLRALKQQTQRPESSPDSGGTMIKVLFLAANPAGTSQLALDEEVRAIDAKIRGAEHRDRLTLVSHWAIRLDDLSGLLMRERPQVVHFSGHGAPSGAIVLLGADGKPKPVPPEALGELFRVLKDNVRAVVLNACYSEPQAKRIVKEIDCAVGMSTPIADDHAIAFAAEFYQALGFGKSVKEAVDLGVARLIGEGATDAKNLIKLHKRRGVDPAKVVLVGALPEPASAPRPDLAPSTDISLKSKPMNLTDSNEQNAPPRVGIITALPHESAAIRAVLGDPPQVDMPGSGAGRSYWMAEIPARRGGIHRVVIAQADMGTNIAAIRANQLLGHFPGIESVIMCGIAGGIPHPTKVEDHVRLGDVVVSNQKGVVQYDFVKRSKGKGKVVNEIRAAPRPPSAMLLEAVRILEADQHFQRYPWEEFLRKGLTLLGWTRPAVASDPLAATSNPSPYLDIPPRREGMPRIFLGPIASANTLLKDATLRDSLRDQFGAKAVEMEGSGIADATWTQSVGYLVVRGICDYSDVRKNDEWQKYAAMAAAAYVRALLESMPGDTSANPR
jgi:nucleoside phosphorylase/tetratricopeptide (TPR) repeat protein